MGSWNFGPFDNDDAGDWLGSLRDSSSPRQLFISTFEEALADEYFDVRVANSTVAAAALIDCSLNNISYDLEGEKELIQITTMNRDDAALRRRAVQALLRVLHPEGELNQLWQENKELFPRWKQMVEGIITRLSA
jgi:hypothetical protein